MTEEDIKTTRVLHIEGDKDVTDKPQDQGGNSGKDDTSTDKDHTIVTVTNNDGGNNIVTYGDCIILMTVTAQQGGYNPSEDPYAEAGKSSDNFQSASNSNSNSTTSSSSWEEMLEDWGFGAGGGV